MKKLWRHIRLAVVVTVTGAGVLVVGSPSVSGASVVGDYIVHVKNSDVVAVVDSISSLDVEDIDSVYDEVFDGFSAELTGREVELLRRHPDVAFVEPDMPVSIEAEQTSPSWGLDRIDQRNRPRDSTYTYDTTGAGVTVYVFDTGVDATHIDFGGRVTTGYSVIPGYAANKDCHGHGTHVAGTVGASTYGVAKEVTIVPIKVLACDGSGSVQGIITAIDDWVLPRHVAGTKAIANFSLGGSSTSASLVAAINRLHEAGIPSVVAAGNSNKDACGFSPANTPSAITVGATDLIAESGTNAELEAPYSNFGACVDLFAPGTGIESTRTGGGSQRMSGTSMAAPHVAGAIAVAWEAQPALTSQQVSDLVIGNASLGKIASLSEGSPNTLLFVPRNGKAPSVPLNPTVSLLEGVTTVTWEAPTTEGDSSIDEYYIVSLDNGQVCTTVPTEENLELACAFTDTSVIDHSFVVIASNRHGSSPRSAAVFIPLEPAVVEITPTPQPAPQPAPAPQPTPQEVVEPAPPPARETVVVRKTTRVRALLRKLSMTVTESQKVTARIHRDSKKACALRDGTLHIRSAKRCVVSLRVTDKATRMHSANVVVSVVRKLSTYSYTEKNF